MPLILNIKDGIWFLIMEEQIKFYVSNHIGPIGKAYLIMVFTLTDETFKCQGLGILKNLKGDIDFKTMNNYEYEISDNNSFNFNRFIRVCMENFKDRIYNQLYYQLEQYYGDKFDISALNFQLEEKEERFILPFFFDEETYDWIINNCCSGKLKEIVERTKCIKVE